MKNLSAVHIILLLCFQLLWAGSALAQTHIVDTAEYFWDADPGEGNGSVMVATDGNFDAAMEAILQTNVSIPGTTGPHKLSIRVQDTTGTWGPVFSTIIMVEPAAVTARDIKVTAGEYYWDTDPGQGAATAFLAFDGNFDAAFETIIDANVAIPGTTGPHTLHSRVKDAEGVWGPTFGVLINIMPSTVTARNIKVTAGEYYWDTDPGQGAATAFLAFDGNFDAAFETIIDANVTIPGTTGPHTLHSRVKDAEGVWGPTFGVLINIMPSTVTARNIKVTAGEYFWDTDPGAGSATPYLAFDGNFDAAFETIVDSSVAIPGTTGPHTLHSRVKDAEGVWGPTFGVLINIMPSTVTARNIKVVAGEYYWDTDPGTGNATAYLAFDGNFDAAFEQIINSNVSIPGTTGPHTLYSRVRDVEGVWGPEFGVVIDIWSSVVTARNIKVVAGEYFWDSDPGTGNGTAYLAFDGNFDAAFEQIINSNVNIPATTGAHTLYSRVKDVEGVWGPLFGVVIDIMPNVVNARNIYVKAAEYFFDTDPGQGNATAIYALDGNFNSAFEAIKGGNIPSPVDTGLHALYIRAMDVENNWGPVFGVLVHLDTAIGSVIPTFTGDTVICASNTSVNSTYSATGHGGSTYNWVITGGMIVSGQGTTNLSVQWTGSGPYAVKLVETNAGIPDSIEKVVVINDTFLINVHVEICQGATYFAGGSNQSTTGLYIDVYTGANGCDSSIYTYLMVHPSYLISLDTTICSSDSVFLGGTWTNSPGMYFDTLSTSGFGCDSVIVTTLFVDNLPVVSAGVNDTLCNSVTAIPLNGNSSTGYATWRSTGDGTFDDSTKLNAIYYPSVTDVALGSFTLILSADSVGVCGSLEDSVLYTLVSGAPVFAGNDTSVCAGESVTLSGSGSVLYSWNNGVTNNFAFIPLSTLTYTVTGTDGNGCINKDSVTVVVYTLPVVSAGTDSSFCIGGSITLSGSGASSYLWNNGVTDGVSFSPVNTLNYIVTGTDLNGCKGKDTTTVTVYALPNVFAGTDISVCAGSNLTLSGTGASTYSWNNGVSDGVGFVAVSSSDYIVVGTDGNGCQNSDTMHVNVDAAPVANAGSDDAICEDEVPVIVSASSTTGSGVWNSLGDGNFGNALTSAFNTYTPGPNDFMAGSVVLRWITTNSGSCTADVDSMTITINSNPVVIAGADSILCNGESIILSASGTAGVSYSWNNGVTDGVVFVPGFSDYYVVTGTSPVGCKALDSLYLTVGAASVFAGNDTSLCLGDSLTLTGTGADTYTWNNGISDGIKFLAATGNYVVTGTDLATGCVKEDSVQVIVNALPVVTANALFGIDSICEGEQVVLFGSGAASYIWDNGVVDSTGFMPTSTKLYTVTGTDNNGCQDTDQITVVVNPSPLANAGPDDTICSGASTTLTASGGATYMWNTLGAGATHTVSPTNTTDYIVEVVGNNNCKAFDTVQVVVNPLPVQPVITQTGNTLEASTGKFFQWYTKDGSPIAGATSQTFSPSASATYYVVVSDDNGCEATSELYSFVMEGLAELGIASLEVFPNPTSGQFVLDIKLMSSKSISVRITDVLGREVQALNYGSRELVSEQISLEQQPNGTFIIEVTVDGRKVVQQLILTK